ncbi:MAG: DUF438 domain-containing protein [Thermoguttaceae bacterium]|nr:DUF438 domain-containing protein [Thermoguttaceae bacterium]
MSELINNRAHRIEALKHIILDLHRGAAPHEVKARLKALVRETDAIEIAAMEQSLIAEGVPVEEIRAMCNLHAEVFEEVMTEPALPEIPPGHPVDTFRRENEAIGRAVAMMRAAMAEIRAGAEGEVLREAVSRWQQAANDLADAEKHYARKENLLFSKLEKYGITGPSKVMWAKDDDIRALLKLLGRRLAEPELTPERLKEIADTAGDPAAAEIDGMIFKEENILLPMALETLTEEDWGAVWQDSPDYGWCLVEPRPGYEPPQPAGPPPAAEVAQDRALRFPTGNLTLEQLEGMFRALPVDLTFIDADDRVRYFSEGERIFTRSKAILGRKVQNCHPPKSVHMVEQIVSDFRSGRQDKAEFWIELQGKFIHIRYFAVRGAAGEYLGTLEVTQDLAPLRALSGERRLLEYAPAS